MNCPLPRILVQAPCGVDGIGVVVAAGRAGGLGVLDLVGTSRFVVRDALVRAARFASRPFAVRIETSDIDAFGNEQWPDRLRAVVCVGEASTDWRSLVGRVRGFDRALLAEITTPEDAARAIGAGADGILASGHEAGGRCGEESSFVLLQGILKTGVRSAWVRGVGPMGAAACVAAGASGVVLEGAVLLARESPLDPQIQEHLGRFDGSETFVIGPEAGPLFRVFGPPASLLLEELQRAAQAGGDRWRIAVREAVGWSVGKLWPAGQDAAFAASLARRHVTVGGIVQAVGDAIDRGRALATSVRPLAPGAPLAISHGTRFPIVQGPMTRVSDTTEFAMAVADGGALPLLALATSRGPEVRTLLAEAATRLGERSWGVGLLGFAPHDLRAEQLEAIRETPPPFALIAGGRPDQALELERLGIPTYLHAPSPGLLAQYLRDGSRRFVLEGRECGGHVGPRSSLVLWEQASGVLLGALDRGQPKDAGELHILFAGGIHDARSAAAVSVLAAPLTERGVNVGVLVGTAYLFTREAVGTGAIVPRYQAEALRCRRTVLLKTGPGHEVRVAPSPFAESFETERRRLLAEGRNADQIRETLERLNVGRLRVATKGLERTDGNGSPLVVLDEPRQYERGLYMVGQVAALRDQVTSIAELHRDLCEASTALLQEASSPAQPAAPQSSPSDIAIIGMAAHFPGAADLHAFWQNTLRGFDAITEVPPDRWDWRPYYNPDPRARDKITSKWGGFLPDIPFDPLRYGMPPASLPSIEPAQLLVLEAVRAALGDAGYSERPFPRQRTAVVLGMGGGAAQLAMGFAFRSYLPMLDALDSQAARDIRGRAEPLLPEWTEDAFPGFLLNVTAGRVANRFDFGGANYTVDAACGSSLAAAALAVRELETGAADVVVLGGADTVQNPFTYLAFSKTHAFSPRGRCRPFDASADGIVISEGVGVVILKRLADAERDGDRIYAVIKAVGCSSDGRDRGLTAPNGEGQTRALARAYEKAGVDPCTVGYIEAHGTGTAVGDVVEVNAVSGFLRAGGAAPGSCVIGSVKSMIGHTKCAAGLAGLINATLALHHRVLPPTIGVERLNPNADLSGGPLQVGTRVRPWFHVSPQPRRAGVSAFGFGGTNFHAVLEAYDADPGPRAAPLREWPAELLVWQASDREGLVRQLASIAAQLEAGATPLLRDLAHTLALNLIATAEPRPTIAIIAATREDLTAKLATARQTLLNGSPALSDPRGVYYAETAPFHGAGVAFVFPGQGSQALEMLGDLALAFEEVRSGFESFDVALVSDGRPPIGPKVFPSSTLDDAERERARFALMATDVAQPAIGAATVGMLRLLTALGIQPDAVAGHSYGELVALHAAGTLPVASLALLSQARGRFILQAAGHEPGGMAALAAGPEQVEALIQKTAGVVAANYNGRRQTVIAGARDALTQVIEAARAEGIRAFDLPVSCAFHSPQVAGAREPVAKLADRLLNEAPRLPVFSNLDAAPHPPDPRLISRRLGEHLVSPVRFAAMIEAMHAAGARSFVECGPGGLLSPLVDSILGDRPHLAVSCAAAARPGIPTLLHALGRLIVAGVPVRRLTRLTADRNCRRLDLEHLALSQADELSPASWLINGSRARPLNGPEPRRLGQAPEVLKTAIDQDDTDGGRGPGAESTAAECNGHAPASIRDGRINPARLPDGNAPINLDPIPDGNGQRPSSAPGGLPSSGNLRVIEAFQQTMRTFLEVQQATMLAYLSARPGESGPVTIPAVPHLSSESGPKAILQPEAPPIQSRSASQREPQNERPKAQASPDTSNVSHDSKGIAGRLVEIVRERTGYPAEMLNLAQDLEADLGIDSIKRVEILGTLRDSVEGLRDLAEKGLMDRLTRAKTLGEIVGLIEAAFPPHAHKPIATAICSPEGAVSATNGAAHENSLRRLVLEVVDAPLPRTHRGLPRGGTILLTDDGRGVAQSLAGWLESESHSVKLVGPGDLDLTSPSAVEDYVAGITADRPLTGIVHALPLRNVFAAGLDANAWAARTGPELRGLFLLARAAARALEDSAREAGAFLIAATALGGAFASSAANAFFPGHGGIAGLVKTLAREWPGIRTRVIDLDPRQASETLAARLAAELEVNDGWTEVGYLGDRRVRLRAIERPLSPTHPPLDLAPRQPVLITGGARGITAAIAIELARRWQPILLLAGRSPLPPEHEDPATAGIEAPEAIKMALLEKLRHAGQPVGPRDLDRAYRSLCREREMRLALERMRAADAMVEYARVDVRDSAALRQTLEEWRRAHGDPVGLIHGAGVIHDKLLRDKTPESFERVLSTKLDGALNLASLLRPDSLRFAAFFSSIAGRFGNRGQCDYAAANEALNKLAIWLDKRWPSRVVAVNWGPWAGVGMVSELQDHLGRRGLGMIAPEAGCAALIDELRLGSKGDAEVILAGELGGLDNPLTDREREPAEAVR